MHRTDPRSLVDSWPSPSHFASGIVQLMTAGIVPPVCASVKLVRFSLWCIFSPPRRHCAVELMIPSRVRLFCAHRLHKRREYERDSRSESVRAGLRPYVVRRYHDARFVATRSPPARTICAARDDAGEEAKNVVTRGGRTRSPRGALGRRASDPSGSDESETERIIQGARALGRGCRRRKARLRAHRGPSAGTGRPRLRRTRARRMS